MRNITMFFISKRLKKVGQCFTILFCLSLGLAIPASALTTPGLALPGEVGYISLHQYVSPTLEKDVYKVTLTIDTKKSAGQRSLNSRTEVVVVTEQSQFMNRNDKGSFYYSLPGNDNVDGDPARSDLGTATATMQGYYDKAYWINPFNTNYTNVASHLAATTNHDYSILLDMFFSTRPFDIAQDANLSPNTYLYNMAQGTEMMFQKLSDSTINPNAQTTALGFTAFSGPDDTAFSPYYDQTVHANNGAGIIGTYGYGSISSINHLPMVYPTGFPMGNGAFSGVRYSTRQVTAPGGTNPWKNTGLVESFRGFHTNIISNPAYTGTDLLMEANALLTRSVAFPLTAQKYNTIGPSTLTTGGLIEAKDYTDIIADAQNRFRAATDQDNEVWIYEGLAEAAMIFFGDKAKDELLIDASGAPPFSGAAKGGAKAAIRPAANDPVQRFVVLLTHGKDTNGSNTYVQNVSIMNLVNGMKNSGVQFIVIGIDADGGDPTTSTTIAQTYDPINLSDMLAKNSLAVGGEGDPTINTTVNDDNAWLALISMPMGIKNGDNIIDVGDPASTMSLKTDNMTWSDVINDYQSNGLVQNTEVVSSYYHVPADDPEKIKDLMSEDILEAMTNFGSESTVNITLSEEFSIYKMPEKPIVITSVGTVSQNANSIKWDIGNLSADVIATCSFYVKFSLPQHTDRNGNLYYSVTEFSNFTAKGRYKTEQNTQSPPRVVMIQKDFPKVFVSLSGSVKYDETSSGNTIDKTAEGSVSIGTSSMGGLLIPANGSGTEYTPSVTPVQNMIENESLQEKTESVDVPVTSDKPENIQTVLIVIVSLGALMMIPVIKGRKKDQ